MRTGIGFPSGIAGSTWARVSGVQWDANYPLANAGDLVTISNPARAAATGNGAFTFIMPAKISVGFLAAIAHNFQAGDTIRFRLFTDNNPDPSGNAGAIVADTGNLDFWPSGGPVSPYSSVRPVVLSSPVNARSCYVSFVTNSGIIPEIGGIECAGWWLWPGISPGKSQGVGDESSNLSLAGGADIGQDVWAPRVVVAPVDYWDHTIIAPAGLNFMAATNTYQPFVFVQDADDATSWPRTTMLARNNSLSAITGRAYRHDAFQLNLIEHMR